MIHHCPTCRQRGETRFKILRLVARILLTVVRPAGREPRIEKD
jgi:hypothetical protein